jgi:hypothetical protein
MTLETIVYSLEEQLRLLGEQMLEPRPQEKLQEKLQDDFKENEEMLQRGLKRWQLDLRACQRALNKRQVAAGLLTLRIEELVRECAVAEAYRLALDLDRLREVIAREAQQLPELEAMCKQFQEQIRELRRNREVIQVRVEQP